MNVAKNKRVSNSSIGAEENKMDTSKHDFPEPHKEDNLILKPRAQEDEHEEELVLSPAKNEQQGVKCKVSKLEVVDRSALKVTIDFSLMSPIFLELFDTAAK